MICSSSLRLALFSLALAVLAGCAGPGGSGSGRATSGGGYYKDDGPGSNIPTNLEDTPNAVPRIEQHTKANFRPYTAFGRKYVPVSENSAYREAGTASWYGRKFHGKKTANGETYDMYAMTAAHPTLPLPSYARVTRAGTGKSVIVRINDRGPFHSSRIIDLSYVAAAKLGLIGPGSGKVIVEAITNEDIRNGRYAPGVVPDLPRPEPHMTASAAARMEQATPDALQALADQTAESASLPAAASTLARADTLEPEDGQARHAPEPIASGTGSVYLQFGAFRAAQSANELASKLNARIAGLESRKALVQEGGNLYKVRIGPYASRTEAVNAANRIQEQTGLDSTLALL
jgi:rare lipoprotein A